MTSFFLRSLLIAFCTILHFLTMGQDNFKYRRSSLKLVLIESDKFPNKDMVMQSWAGYPFPDKYNNHTIKTNSVDLNKVALTDEDLLKAGYLKDTLNNILEITKAVSTLKELRYLNDEKTKAVVVPDEKKAFQLKLDKTIKEKRIANQLIASWFNQKDNGKFDMSVVQDRGYYNASELEAEIAKGQSRGLAALADAGEELINNTFITFTKLDFVENEPAARLVRDAAIAKADQEISIEILRKKAYQSAEEVYNKTKEGYSLWSKTWLYKLKWDETIANEFYSKYWDNPASLANSDFFTLEFVGTQYNQSLVTFSLTEKRTESQIIDLALVRNLDRVFAELQKENDVFKPVVPVLSVSPITAQIGMKEGLEGGEKFDVFEMGLNQATGKTEYKKIARIKIDKANIWDNRYYAGQKPDERKDEKGNVLPELKASYFEDSKKVQPGMLLKQVK